MYVCSHCHHTYVYIVVFSVYTAMETSIAVMYQIMLNVLHNDMHARSPSSQ